MDFGYEFTENILELPEGAKNEIIGRIFLQSKILMPDGNYPEADKFSNIVFDITHKLFAMLYHKTTYIKKVQANIKISARIISRDSQSLPMTGDLSFEFEAFLFQTKSALDMSIKVLNVLFPGHFRVHTFENKGKTIIKNLEQFKKAPLFRKGEKILKNRKQQIETRENRIATIDTIINRLGTDKLRWLDKVISMRDTFAHYTVIRGSDYKVERTEPGNIIITAPKLNGLDPCDFMERVFKNCLEFIQEFLSLLVSLWLPGSFELKKAHRSHPAIKSWSEAEPTLVNYLKYTLRCKT